MEKEIALLPCPFCGGPGYLCQIPSASGGDRFIWVAKCSAEEGCGVEFLGCSRKVDAIKEWNRRDREARLVEALELIAKGDMYSEKETAMGIAAQALAEYRGEK